MDYPAGIFLGKEFFEALKNKLYATDFLMPFYPLKNLKIFQKSLCVGGYQPQAAPSAAGQGMHF